MDADDDLATFQTPPKRRRLAPALPSRATASDHLLAQWGAVKSPTSVSQKLKRESLRNANPVRSYAESPPTSPTTSNLTDALSDYEDTQDTKETANLGAMDETVVTSDEEDELTSDDVIHVAQRTYPMRAAGARDLPARSTRAKVSYARPVRKKKKSKKSKDRFRLKSDADTASSKPKTARALVREDIAIHTKPKRDAFLLANKECFLPLLPENNYITKLERTASIPNDVEELVYRQLDEQPQGVKATMKPYQLEGLSFLVHMHMNGMSSILGDEMGLGKTLQTLSLFQYLREKHSTPAGGEHRPNLVVCPLSVLSSWIAEARRWVPEQNIIRFHGPKAERDKFKRDCLERKLRFEKGGRAKDAHRIDLVVTTYETFTAEQGWFKRTFVWRYCVLDEGHKIKNEKSDISSALHGLSAEYRLLLTGTPLQNNLREMWALLHWLFPEVFVADTADNFGRAFDLTKGNVSTSFMDDARRLLELIMIRRMKSSSNVNLGLPPKEEVLLYVPLTPMQRFWYTRLLTRTDTSTLEALFASAKDKEAAALQEEGNDEQLALLEKAGVAMEAAQEADNSDVWAESKAIMEEALQQDQADKETSGWKKLMNLLMQLRKVCSHPYLLPSAAPQEYDIGDHVKNASGKFIVLEKLLDELVVKQGKKVLIFSGFTKTLDLVGELLHFKGANDFKAPFRYARFDGGTSRAQRNLNIRLFNDKQSEYKVMLLSTRAGGLGINLTSATEVVFMDEDWNPQVTLQAEARAHRIGQTQKVTIYKLCSQGTVEEQMMGRIRKKLYLSAKITESMRNIHSSEAITKKRKRQSTNNKTDEDAPQLDTASLQSLIRRGAQTLTRPELNVTEMLGWDWEMTLEKCKDKPIDTLAKDEASSEVDEQQWLNSMEKVECAVFEGKKHQKELEAKAKGVTILNRGDRRVGKNTTVEIDGFMINKESLLCADWEAVPTFAGKDPRLAEPVREKKKPIRHQDECQSCWDGGHIVLCSGCPRSYHQKCLGSGFKSRAVGGNFYCPQHECRDCGSKTAEAGGMIYRCRWCEYGFCEDCLEWDKMKLVGSTLPEFQLMNFGAIPQAYFIECPSCLERFDNDEDARGWMLEAKARHEREYEDHLEAMDTSDLSAAVSGADFTPNTISEAVTPAPEAVPKVALRQSGQKKQKF